MQVRGMHLFSTTRAVANRPEFALRSLLTIKQKQTIFLAGPLACYTYWIATLAVQSHNGSPLNVGLCELDRYLLTPATTVQPFLR